MISLNNLIVEKLMSLRFFYPYTNVHDESAIVTGEWLLRSIMYSKYASLD